MSQQNKEVVLQVCASPLKVTVLIKSGSHWEMLLVKRSTKMVPSVHVGSSHWPWFSWSLRCPGGCKFCTGLKTMGKTCRSQWLVLRAVLLDCDPAVAFQRPKGFPSFLWNTTPACANLAEVPCVLTLLLTSQLPKHPFAASGECYSHAILNVSWKKDKRNELSFPWFLPRHICSVGVLEFFPERRFQNLRCQSWIRVLFFLKKKKVSK